MTPKQEKIKAMIIKRLYDEFDVPQGGVMFSEHPNRSYDKAEKDKVFEVYLESLDKLGHFFTFCGQLHNECCWTQGEFQFSFVYRLPHEWKILKYPKIDP